MVNLLKGAPPPDAPLTVCKGRFSLMQLQGQAVAVDQQLEGPTVRDGGVPGEQMMMMIVIGSYLMAILLKEAQRALGLARSRPSRAL